LWSLSAVAVTLTETLNAAHGVEETRSWRKRCAFAVVLGPLLALAAIVATGLVPVGPRLAEGIFRLAGMDEEFVACGRGCESRSPSFCSRRRCRSSTNWSPTPPIGVWPATPDALFAVFTWAIASVRLSFYLATFPDRGVTRGSLGTAVDLLFYMYPSAAVMPMEAETTQPFTACAEGSSLSVSKVSY
jgi:uncharacterized BrkB/YihY/UPF0761 family membrane protein